MNTKATVTIPATLTNLEKMIDFLIDAGNQLNLNKKNLSKLRLVSEEALLNIINYAYPNSSGDISITYETNEQNGLTIQIKDQGIAFNPLEKKDPNIDLPLEERKIGGLGIYMIKQIMDDVHYKRENNSNILTMSKKHF